VQHLQRAVIPHGVRELQSAANCRSLTSFGMTNFYLD
jgi:hypothetical protein